MMTKQFSYSKDRIKGVLELIRIKERKFGGIFGEGLTHPKSLYEKRKYDSDLYQILK